MVTVLLNYCRHDCGNTLVHFVKRHGVNIWHHTQEAENTGGLCHCAHVSIITVLLQKQRRPTCSRTNNDELGLSPNTQHTYVTRAEKGDS
jgi:hypothetical protein